MPTCFDVLCGSGIESANHAGNKFFSLTVSKYVEQYVLAESKPAKMRVSKAAFDELTISGVRFLKRHTVGQYWYVATSQRVGRDKIGHFLRQYLPKAMSGSGNKRLRQRPASTVRPLPSARSSYTPLSTFLLGNRTSSHGHPENTTTVWSMLKNLEGRALPLAPEENANHISSVIIFPTKLVPSNQVSVSSRGNDTFNGARCKPSFLSTKALLTPTASNRMDTSILHVLPLEKEPADKNTKVCSNKKCRLETPFSFLAEAEEQKSGPVKYQSPSVMSTSCLRHIGSFSSVLSSSEVPKEAELVSSLFSWISDMHDDSSESDLSRDDLFDDFELAQISA